MAMQGSENDSGQLLKCHHVGNFRVALSGGRFSLCLTYNHGPYNLLKKEWTQKSGTPGGRVFITLSGVKRIDESGREFDLCTWDWPVRK